MSTRIRDTIPLVTIRYRKVRKGAKRFVKRCFHIRIALDQVGIHGLADYVGQGSARSSAARIQAATLIGAEIDLSPRARHIQQSIQRWADVCMVRIGCKGAVSSR